MDFEQNEILLNGVYNSFINLAGIGRRKVLKLKSYKIKLFFYYYLLLTKLRTLNNKSLLQKCC